ncbi:MAG: TetR/AcrR family transcriptional regulator [Balneolaceae bacterium]
MSETDKSLRDRILEISRHLLFDEGYQTLSMRKIAKLAGVSATSIYLYFENKDHLLHTIIEESVEELSQAVEKSVDTETDIIRKFEAIIHGYITFAIENPEKYQVIYMIRPNKIARYPKEKFRKTRRCYELLVKIIEEGVSKGVMDVGKPVMAAYSIWAQLHGIVSVVLNQRLDSRIDRNQFITESVEHVVQGFLIRTTVL